MLAKDYSLKGCPIRARPKINCTISSICSSYDLLLVIKDSVRHSRQNSGWHSANSAACLSSVVTMDSWTLVLGIRPNPNDNDSLPFTLLPLQLDMFGSVAVPSSSIHTEYSTPSWKRYEDVLAKLHGLPVLRFHDAELYYELHFTRHWKDNWTSRRYQEC
jgi:hypothetical protein